MDYAAWLQRAADFVGSHGNTYPCQSHTSEIDLPSTESDIVQIETAVKHSLPKSIRAYFATASASAYLGAIWAPPHPAAKTAFQTLFGNRTTEFAMGSDGFLRLQYLPQYIEHAKDAIETAVECYRADRTTLPAIPLPICDFASGNCLAVDLAESNGDSPVYYISHEDQVPIPPIATSFDDFLARWESAHYVSPDRFEFSVFLDPNTGLLGSPEVSEAFKDLMIRHPVT